MTGATAIIKSGGKCRLGKVRHSGDDVEDFFTNKCLAIPPDQLWAKYLAVRRTGMSALSRSSEIQTTHDAGFEFLDSGFVPPQVDARRFFDEATEYAEQAIEALDPYDGYLCGYGDYEIIVDYDTGTIITL